MASKEVKTLLKKARDSIRNKEYKDALKHCKAALKLEKNNYNALVFVGVCATELGQLEQAQAAYKKASDEDPSQVLAWQGLASLYEKNQEFRQDLAGVYVQLLQLYERGDKLKWKEISLKLCDLYNQQGHFLKGADILEELIKSSEDEAEQYTWWSQIAEMLTEELQATDLTEIKLKLDRAYQHLTQEEWPYRTQEDLAKHYISYIQFLLKIQIDSNSEVCEETRQRVLYQCQAMAKACPGSAFPLETLGKLWLEDDDAGDAPSVFERLCELEPSSGVGLIGMGCQQMKNKDLSGALQNLEKGLQSSPQCTAGWLYLAQTRLGCHDYSHAEKSSKKGLSCLDSTPGMIRRSQFSFKLSLVMAEALYKQGLGKAAEAKLVYEQLLKESKSLEVYTGLGEALLVLGETNAANEACSKALEINTKYHPALALQGKISHHEGFNDDAELRFLEAIELCEDCALYHFLLGKLYWEMNGNLRADKSKCLAQFLMAARLDPHYSATFLHLGHYYRLAGNDLRRACRCYQKSFDLNPKDDNAGSHLCDLLSQLGEEDAVMGLLSRVTKAAPPGEGKWSWLRLGLYYLRHNDSNNSVTCFQNTLRADLKDRHCWECLGEAYLSRGSYTAALKAFTRATELDPTSTYSLYQTAAIKQLLCIFSEAVQEYREILGPKPDYVPALKGLGEACLCLARSALAEDFNSRAVDHVGEGLHALAKAVEVRPGMSCLWKLIGDCCTVLHPVASSSVSLPLPEVLQKCLGNDSVAVAGKKELLSIGTSAYGRALKCLPDCASLWNDLGFSYFLQAKVAEEGRDRLAQRAVQVLKKGVSLEPTNHKLWNTLGVVCGSSLVDNPDLSQHAFIMSIKTEPNNVSAWTNLGVLYLKHGKVEPAHDAFKYAQALDPSYTAAWVGQATIAEIIGSDEAADLFRHTTELSSHTESSVGYCHWICTDLLSGDRIKANKPTPSLSHLPTGYRRAVLNASVAMTKYTDRIRGIAGAYNMHGLLLEHQCLYRQAQRAFHSAVKLLEGDSAEQDLLNTVHINHARALSALGRHDEAVAEYLQVKPLTDFYDVCGLALAYYLSGNIAESYRTYEEALQLASTDYEKACVLTALGMLGYKLKELATAKSLLFKSSQLSQPCERGLMALCALGLVTGDSALAGAALGELMKLGGEGNKDLHYEICCLFSRFYTLQGDPRLGLRHIVKAVHRHPDRAELWDQLAAFIVQVCPDDLQAASRCAEGTVKLDPVTDGTNRTLYPASILGSGTLPTTGDPPLDASNLTSRSTYALRASQKALRMYPGHVTNWAVFVSAVTANGIAVESVTREKGLHRLALKLSRYVSAKASQEKEDLLQSLGTRRSGSHASLADAVYKWTLLHTGYCLLNCGLTQEALQHCEQVLAAYSDVPQLSTDVHFLKAQVLLQMGDSLETGLNSLQASVLSSPHHSAHAWQLVAQVQSKLGAPMAAELCYRQCLQAGSGKRSTSWRLVPLIRLALLALQQIQANEANRERWEALCTEASTEVLKLDPSCTAARLIQAVAQCILGNTRSARRSLQCVSDTTSAASLVARYWLLQLPSK